MAKFCIHRIGQLAFKRTCPRSPSPERGLFNTKRGLIVHYKHGMSVRRSATLLDNLERGALAVARSRAAQERADRVNRLAVAANHAANVALTQLQFEDGRLAAGNF